MQLFLVERSSTNNCSQHCTVLENLPLLNVSTLWATQMKYHFSLLNWGGNRNLVDISKPIHIKPSALPAITWCKFLYIRFFLYIVTGPNWPFKLRVYKLTNFTDTWVSQVLIFQRKTLTLLSYIQLKLVYKKAFFFHFGNLTFSCITDVTFLLQ